MGKEKPQSIVETIKKALLDAPQGAAGIPEELLFIPKDGTKVVRFLSEFDEAVPIIMHDKFGSMFPQPCLKYFKKPCQFHGGEFKTTTQYGWTVLDYESGAKKLALWKATLASPIERLLEIYESNGTVKDRDIKLQKMGSGPKTRVKAMEVQKEPTDYETSAGKNKPNKPFSQEKVFEIVQKMVTKESAADVTGDDESVNEGASGSGDGDGEEE